MRHLSPLILFVPTLAHSEESPESRRSLPSSTAVWWFTPSTNPNDNKAVCTQLKGFYDGRWLGSFATETPLYADCVKLAEVFAKQNGIYTARNFTPSTQGWTRPVNLASHGSCVFGISPYNTTLVKPEEMYSVGTADINAMFAWAIESEKVRNTVTGVLEDPPAGYKVGFNGKRLCAFDATTIRTIAWGLYGWDKADS